MKYLCNTSEIVDYTKEFRRVLENKHMKVIAHWGDFLSLEWRKPKGRGMQQEASSLAGNIT